MAESYRGLTIKIGGDTSKLTAALKTANQAISGTQSELRRLNQAMKLDPTSFDASKLQVGALASQASNSAKRVVELRRALEELSNSMPKDSDQTFGELVESTRDAQMQAQLATKSYTELTKSLAEVYTEVTQITRAAYDTKLPELKANLDFGALTEGKTTIDAMLASLEKLPSYMRPSKEEMQSFAQNAKVALDAFKNAGSEIGKVLSANEFQEARDKLMAAIEPLYNFDSDNTGVDEIKQALNEAAESVKVTDERIGVLVSTASRLKKPFLEAKDAMDTSKTVAQLEDLNVEEAKTAAQTESLVQQLVKAGQTSEVARGFGAIDQQLKSIDTSMASTKRSLADVDKALKLDPKNPKLIAERMQLVKTGTAEAAQKADLLREKLQAYDPAKVNAVAKGTEDVGKKAREASEAYAESIRKYVEANGKLRSAQEMLNTLKNKGTDQTADDLKEIQKLEAELPQLEAAANAAADAMDRLRGEQGEAFEGVEIQGLITDFRLTNSEVEHFGQSTKKVDTAAFMQSLNMIAQAARRAGQEIVQSANDIDSAYRDMRKTVNATESEYERLKDAAIEYSKNSFTSADTMLEMQALGGQLGILQEDLEQFGKISSNLDIATNISAEDIALQLGQVANVLDLDIDGMQGFADALVRLGNNMPAQESAIMNVAQRFGAVASTANFSGAEILAWSAAIASTGQRSEMAATAIGNTVSGIEQAVATGGKDIKAFATIAGESAEDFAAEWQASPTQALKKFIEGLHNMTESKESAVAALENMGITGVRQQQTLLGLSQTIGNLDNALAMSGNAWNQVSDKWGQAGDAANEAFKKSQGFSGALAILQNNAQNLAASFGDGLVPLMQVAADILGVLTDTFNAMPAPLKTAYAGIATFGVGMSTILPVINVFKDGWGSLFQSLANSGGVIGNFIRSVSGITPAMEGAAASSSVFGSVLGGPVTMAIAGLALVITGIVTAIDEYKQEQDTLRQATDGLVGAMDAAQSAYDSARNGVSEVKKSFSELADEIKHANEEQATLAEELEQKWSDVGTAEATVDGLIEKITTLTSKSSLSAHEQQELVASVEAFNATTGSSVGVVDKVNGKLDTGLVQLKNYAAAWKENTESEAALESWLKTSKELEENERLLAEAEAEAGKWAQATAGQHERLGKSMGGVLGVSSDLDKRIAELKNDIAANKEAMARFESQIGDTEKGIRGVETELNAVGDSLDNYGDLTDQELAKVVEAYLNAADSSKSALEVIRDMLNQIKQDKTSLNDEFGENVAEDMEELSKEAAKKRKEDLKQQFEDENRLAQQAYDDAYKDKQRELDDIQKLAQRAADDAYKQAQKAYDAEYKQAQKAFDAEYKAVQKDLDAEYNVQKKYYDDLYNQQKKALDAEYNAQKKHYDALYDQQKKALDKEYEKQKKQYDSLYDQKKKALDAEYDQQKKAYDEQYSQKKKSLDKQYNQEKKAYDERYNQQKKALDKEYEKHKKQLDSVYEATKDSLDKQYKQRKKQYDAQLKLLKDQQDDEVDAFKKATDAKLKEMEREYKARVKALEAEYGGKTDDIDGRIKALNAETEAEKKAIEERNQNEKVAELKLAVENAKSRRKRADAEKELNEYLQELEQKRNEDARNAEIERLNEKKSDLNEELNNRKEKLKEEYDAEVEAYKMSREQQLEALQTANEAEYEKRQEQFDLQLEQLKAHQQAQLDSLKEVQQVELDAVKEANDQKLETVKEGYDLQLEALKENHQKQLDSAKEVNDRQLEMLKENHQSQLDATKEANTAQLESVKEAHQAQLENLKESHQEQLEIIKENHQSQLDITKENNNKQLESFKDTQTAQLEALKDSQQAQLEALKDSQQTALDNMKQGQQDELDILKQGHQDQLADLKRAQQDELNERKKQQDEELEIAQEGTDEQVQEEERKNSAIINSANALKSGVTAIGEEIVRDLGLSTKKGVDDTENTMKQGEIDLTRVSEKMGNGMMAGPLYFASMASGVAHDSMAGYSGGIESGGRQAENSAQSVASNVSAALQQPGNSSESWGWDMLINFGNGVVKAWNNGGVMSTLMRILEWVANYTAFSVPKKGPLHHQDEWGGHFMDNIIAGIRSKEGELIRQTTRVAEAMENAFDPTLTVDAAYEAIGSINKGRTASYTPNSPSGDSDSSGGFIVNINFGDVSVRNDADIERLANEVSRQMVTQAKRHGAGRL